ncbi:MAG TPA: hypothetical protein VNJ53_01970 [Gaiellaceae bacterium]|nr:hypothetical protein [Gaiellaceae bacterium]
MVRLALAAFASVLLLLPVAADGSSVPRIRGVVTAKDQARSFVTVESARRMHVLRVPATAFDRIRLGLRVELRGTTLRARGHGSRVLARDVLVIRSQTPAPRRQGDDENDDDERELEGTLTSLSPPTVANGARTLSCAAPAGLGLSGFAVGDRVELTCDLLAGVWTVRKLEQEDDDAHECANADDDDREDDEHEDDDESSGPGGGDDDD